MSTSGTQVAERDVELTPSASDSWRSRRWGPKTPGEWLAAYGAVFVLIVLVIVFSILTIPRYRCRP